MCSQKFTMNEFNVNVNDDDDRECIGNLLLKSYKMTKLGENHI